MASELFGRQFGWQVALRIGIFGMLMFGVSFTLGIIDIVRGIDVSVTEMIRFSTATFTGVLLVVLLAVSLVRPGWRRAQSLGVHGYFSLIVPFLVLADIPIVVATRPEESFGTSFSSFDGRVPLYFLTAFCIIIAMVFARSQTSSKIGLRRLRIAGTSAIIVGILIVLRIVTFFTAAIWMGAVRPQLGPEDVPPELLLQLMKNSYWPYVLNPYFCGLFVVLIMWCVLISRRSENAAET